MNDERELLRVDKIFRWDGPKRKSTMFSAKVGTLVLTDRRLLYYSAGNAMLGGASSLEKSGAVNVSLADVRNAELTTMWGVLTVTWTEGGREVTATFADKVAGMPDGIAWRDGINRLRESAAGR